MKQIYEQVEVFKPKRSLLDLTHEVKLTGKQGMLIPVNCMEVVPTDRVSCAQEAITRFAPMLAPPMHRYNISFHTYFCPLRILWGHTEQYITNGGSQPGSEGDVPDFPTLTVQSGVSPYTKLMDYLGIPPYDGQPGGNPDQTEAVVISAIPFAVYQKIYNDYYRDQNLTEQLVAPGDFIVGDGSNDPNFALLATLRNRAWEHDYFTSALPFAQKGAAVRIPLIGQDVAVWRNDNAGGGNITATPTNIPYGSVPSDNPSINAGQLYADTSELTAESTINDLRRAYAVQRYLEKNARGGTRLFEWILMHFGMRSPDKRLQRPEYIGGSVNPVVIGEVLQTGEAGTTPQGNMAGHGLGVTNNGYSSYFVEEHGYIMTLMSVMPKTAYQQGIPKHFLKVNEPEELFTPDFEHIGEQPIVQDELYAYADPNGVNKIEFGFTPRYCEYKDLPNRVCGDFRTSLNFWHSGRIFEAPPLLNEDFVISDPTNRIFAVQDGTDNLWIQVLNKIKASRPMSRFGTPF